MSLATSSLEPSISNSFDDALLTFAFDYNKTLSLVPNTSTAGGLSNDAAKSASIDPVESYIKSLPPSEPQVTLTVAKEAQSIWSIAMLVENKEEIECIVDSGSQIISMSAKIANSLGIIYDPNIILNMQSANGTMDKSLGLARNVPCSIGNITFYLQIHILWSPAYDILLGRPFDVLACCVLITLNPHKTTLTITDPNSGLRCTLPTFSRGRIRQPRTKVHYEEEPPGCFWHPHHHHHG